MDVSYDSSEERVKPISVDPLNSKETKASLSGMEPEFEFIIASNSNEEMDSQPFVDCFQKRKIFNLNQLMFIRSWSLMTSGGSKASSTRQEDKPKFLHDHR
ncbi:hypothetical protein AMTRI_Chr09g18000 [Amborella trichopoda]